MDEQQRLSDAYSDLKVKYDRLRRIIAQQKNDINDLRLQLSGALEANARLRETKKH